MRCCRLIVAVVFVKLAWTHYRFHHLAVAPLLCMVCRAAGQERVATVRIGTAQLAAESARTPERLRDSNADTRYDPRRIAEGLSGPPIQSVKHVDHTHYPYHDPSRRCAMAVVARIMSSSLLDVPIATN